MNDNLEYLDPFNSTFIRFKKINESIKDGDFEMAEKLAKEWRDEECENSESWRASAIVYFKKNDMKKSLTCVEFAQNYENNYDPRCSFLEAEIYIKNKDYKKADDIYINMIKKYKTNNITFVLIFSEILINKAELSLIINPISTEFHLEVIDSFFNKNPKILNEINSERILKIKKSYEEAKNGLQFLKFRC